MFSASDSNEGIVLRDTQQQPMDDRDCEMTNFNNSMEDSNHSHDVESSQPLLVDKKLSNREMVSLIPMSFVRALDFIRRRWKWIGSLIILITVLDVLIFYLTAKGPKIHKVEISFSPSGSDAEVQIIGDVNKDTWTSSFDVSSGSCAYYYRKDSASDYKYAGELLFILPDETNEGNNFNVTIQAKDTQYDALRRIYWDVSSKLEATSSVKVDCNIDLYVKLYHALPATYTLMYSQELDLADFQLSSEKKVKTGEKQNNLKPKVYFENKDMSTTSINYDIIVQIDHKKKLTFGGNPIDSFIIHLPKMAYGAALVDRDNEKKSYLKVRTDAVTFDLNDNTKPVVIDFKIGCIPAGRTIEEARESDDTCTLLSPMSFRQFRDEYNTNKFMNITAHSIHRNFLSMFLGEEHYIRTTDPANFPFSGEEVMEGLGERRQLSAYHTTDPAISTGADCVTVDSDGVYISQACSVVEEGFFKLYVGIYNDGGFTGYLKSVTSWAPSGEIAFDSELEGELVSAGTAYKVIGDVFFSETFQNLTGVVGFNYSDTQAFLETLTANWDFPTVSSGIVQAKSVTLIEGYQPVKAYALLDYGDDLYAGKVLISDTAAGELGDALTAYAAGAYGGNWYKWYATVNESTLIYDQTVEGHATGEIHYDVPAAGTQGTITLLFDVVDGSYNTVTASNFTGVGWYTDDVWTTNGNIIAVSVFELLDGNSAMVTWNATGAFLYGDGTYTLYALENPLDISSNDNSTSSYYYGDDAPFNSSTPMVVMTREDIATLDMNFVRTSVHNVPQTTFTVPLPESRRLQADDDNNGLNGYDDYLYLVAYGHYGGNWYKWYATLTGGILVLDSTTIALAVGEVTYDVPSSGTTGQITATSQVVNNVPRYIFQNKGIASWSTPSSWSNEGSLFALSEVNVYGTQYNWNATGTMTYGNNQYNLVAYENHYGTSPYTDNVNNNQIYLVGYGSYGGSNWNNWYGSVDFSELILYKEPAGTATGNIIFDVDSTGTIGNVKYAVNVTGDFDETALTPGADTQLVMYTYMNLINIKSYTLNTNDENAIVLAAAEAMGLNASDVMLTGYYMYTYSYDPYTYAASLYMQTSVLIDSASDAYNMYFTYSNALQNNFNSYLPSAVTFYNATDLSSSYSSYTYSYILNIYDPTYQYTKYENLYYSNSEATWNTLGGWNNDGSIVVQSQAIWDTFANWNASGAFSYGDNMFYLVAKENNFDFSSSATNATTDDDNYGTPMPSSRPTSQPTWSDAGTLKKYNDEFYVVASGSYGANSVYDW